MSSLLPAAERQLRRQILLAAGLGLSYYIGARIGFLFQSPVAPQSVMWLPNSILLSVLLVSPRRQWPWYLAAVLPAQLAIAFQDGHVLPIGLLYFSNCGDALLGAYLVQRLAHGHWRMDRAHHMLLFIVVGATLSPVIMSFVDAGITSITAWSPNYWQAWLTRVRANVLTNIVVVPALVISTEMFRRPAKAPRRDRVIEGSILLTSVGLVTFVAFASNGHSETGMVMPYLPLLLLLWVAVRFGAGMTGTALFIVAVLSSWQARQSQGFFEGQSPVNSLVALQLFLLAISVPVLGLSTVVSERQRTIAALRRSERRALRQFAQLSAIYRSAPVGLGFINPELRYVSVNERMAELNGISPGEHKGRSVREVLPELASQLEVGLRHALVAGEPALELQLRGASPAQPGVARDWVASFEPVRDARARIIGVNVVAEEISERKRAEAILRDSQNALSASYAQIQDLLGRLITAQEAERARIARELHDDCNQRLAAMAIAIDNLRRGGLNSKTATAQALEDLQRRVITLSQNLREISHDLHPGVLQHAGLVMALRGSCAEVSGVHDLKVDFDAPPDLDPLPADLALCLYRVTQEALHNVVRHSAARNARVTLARRFDEIVLTVADDGRGFIRGQTNGLGLISIDERVRLLNGNVSLQSAPGHGTTLRVNIPIGVAAEKPQLAANPQ